MSLPQRERDGHEAVRLGDEFTVRAAFLLAAVKEGIAVRAVSRLAFGHRTLHLESGDGEEVCVLYGPLYAITQFVA